MIRPVEQSSPLVIVIVTIGMFLAINSLTQLQFGSGQQALPSFYPQHTWRPGGVLISSDTLVLVAVLAVECLLLYLLLQRTKLGLAFRGVASNPESSRLLGVPVGRILMVGWGLAAAVGALAGALVVPTTTGLVPSSMQQILVFAFAAAALGGFDSVFGAVVGGLIVGVADALTIGYVHALRGIDLLVPFGLILLVLLFRPVRPVRQHAGGAGLMANRNRIVRLAVIGHRGRRRDRSSSVGIFPTHYGATDTDCSRRRCTSGSAAMGLNLLTGYNGQVSIGHGAFFGIGAYTTALLMDHQYDMVGYLLRPHVVRRDPARRRGRLVRHRRARRVPGAAREGPLPRAGDARAGGDLPRPRQPLRERHRRHEPGVADAAARSPRPTGSPNSFRARRAGPVGLHDVLRRARWSGSLVVWVMARSRFGRSLIAVRDHEAAATSVGINLARTKVLAFALSAMYAGIAGSLSVLVVQNASGDDKVETFQLSIEFLVAVVIGGTATVLGPLIGGFAVVYIQKWATDAFPSKPVVSPAIFGIVLIVLMYVLPEGVVGGVRRLRAWTQSYTPISPAQHRQPRAALTDAVNEGRTP